MTKPTLEEVKMDAKTLAALKDSIAHWKRLYTGKRKAGELVGPTYCELCRMFNHNYLPAHAQCSGCPVRQFTGVRYCSKTPYPHALSVYEQYGIDSTEFQTAAKKEYDFLRSLLPKDDK